ncbi:MAG: Hpt domain-containing protein [Deltaproteobacteria bacterium]|jgi:HPt (histidine-containing phosphotransfer) domain-containing protein|nr:Hpt domain-containing protein [Deltaproteobacteria bacterium]
MTALDISMGLRNLNGNEQLYNKLLRRFADSNIQAGQEIRTAVDAGDNETAVRLAHTLKGVAASLGAPDLSAEALTVEQLLKNGGTLEADGLNALEAALGQALEAINARLG